MTDMHVNEPILREIMKIQATQAGKISNLDNKIGGVEKKVDKILFYIENDDATGTKGVISKQKDMSKRISKIENGIKNDKLKTKTTIATASFIGGLIATVGGFLAKYVLFK